jgi:predicted  nucleic acid-binding Zn-ribbon protein
VNTTLQTLIQLQDIDSVILDLQRKIAEFPEIARRLDQQLTDEESKLLTLQSHLEEQEKARRTKEVDVEARIEQIKKYQNQLLQVKTNKEYSALLAEIQGLKNKNSLTEDDILELMEGVERAKKAIVETRRHLEQEKTKIKQAKQEQEAEQVKLQHALAEEQGKHRQLIDKVEDKVLQEYTKLLKLRNGVAVTRVKDEGICNGCHVALTPQMFAEVKTREQLHRCPVCFRFLYWSDERLPDQEGA